MSDDDFMRNRSTVAIITGGTQGLGLAIARRLAREGAPGMVIRGRNAEKGEGAAEKLRSLGTDCLPLSFIKIWFRMRKQIGRGPVYWGKITF
jgi:NAD(P)-dependent dehydrogenase (short-subunit alcohol dehydrogenase family)